MPTRILNNVKHQALARHPAELAQFLLMGTTMTTRLDATSEGTALERAEAAALPTIRSELPDDIDAIAELHRAAFGGPAEAELVDAIRRSAFFVPALSLVADLNGQLVGHVLLSRVDLVSETGHRTPFFALAPIAVAPMHQGNGFGTLLMRAAVALAQGRDEEAGIAVLGSPEFYRRFGFQDAAELDISGPWSAPGGVFQVLPLTDAAAVPGGILDYPAAFSSI
ncbi:MAG: N-acetyltransferase [Chloroflexota bacterium]